MEHSSADQASPIAEKLSCIVLTLFPELIEHYCSISILGRAQKAKILSLQTINLRQFADPPHYHVDDAPYGGGAGMVGKPEPVALAIREARRTLPNARVISLAPSGRRLRQRDLKIFAQLGSLIFLCGRYEGIDQRVVDTLCDDEISLGDFVLMGGELAALAVIEGTTRLIPGALGNTDSLSQESFSDNVLVEAPQYTRPEEFEGSRVPEILLSGNHSHIAQWRTEQAIAKSTQRLHEELQALRERTSALRKLKKSVGA